MRSGDRRHHLTLENPATPVPDGDGGFTQTWAQLSPPQVWAALQPATAQDLERVAAGSVLSTSSHIATFPYHSGVTTKTRLTKGPRNTDGTLPTGSREFAVTGVSSPDERHIETVALCAEIVP